MTAPAILAGTPAFRIGLVHMSLNPADGSDPA